jgi:hypothetical protein
MTGECVGTVTTMPDTEGGRELLNDLRDEYTVELDQVHRDGNVNFIIRE